MIRTLASLTALLAATPALADPTVALEFRGAIELPQDLTVDGLSFGGISGLALDAETDQYYAIADDLENPRVFTLTIDLADGRLDDGDIAVTGAVLLADIDQRPFAGKSVDPEGIAITGDGTLLIAAEPVGDKFPAFIREFDLDGTFLRALPLDALRYDPRFDPARGAMNSGGFESLVMSDDGATLVAAFEKPLKQDAPAYDNGRTESSTRILELDPVTGEVDASFVYRVGAMTIEPTTPDGGFGRGLNDLGFVEPGRFLAVERQYAAGVTDKVMTRPVEIFEVSTEGATDVADVDTLSGQETPVAKELVLDLETVRTAEGLSRIGSHEMVFLGPELDDGARALIMIEDNDFERPTQVLLFALTRTGTAD